MGPKNRKAIHAFVSLDSHETIHRVSADEGVTVSGLLEALAGNMDKLSDDDTRLPWEALVAEGKRIDYERRRRA